MPEKFHVHEHRGRRAGTVLLLGLLVCIFVAAAHAQVIYGTLTGNVTDPTNAAIAKSKVEALNTQTGVLQTTETDATGVYRFNALQAGVYKITVSAGGFAAKVYEAVPVEVNIARRLDAQLAVAAQQQIVNVSAEAAILQTEKADVHANIPAKDINDLPILRRSEDETSSLCCALCPGSGICKRRTRPVPTRSAP